MALQAGDIGMGWWLDMQTGEVIPAPDPGKKDRLQESRSESPDRYMDVEPLPEDIMVDLMASFVTTIEDADSLCLALREALNKDQAVWHFKNTLATSPGHEDAWYAFKEQFYAMQARQWLRERNLVYEVRDTRQPPGQEAVRSPSILDHALLSLTLSPPASRAYVVWREGETTMLVAFDGPSARSGPILGQTVLDAARLEGIDHILEQLQPKLNRKPVKTTPGATASLEISRDDARILIEGPLIAGSVSDQLKTLFDVLLGIAP